MRALSINEKQNVKGGFGPMMAWVLITGACLLVSTISSLFQSSDSNGSHTPTSYNPDNPYSYNSHTYSSKKTSYMRVSPMASSSAFYLPV